MEDFMTLLDRGVIYDGCPIVAKGTIRINNGEISIDTMHNLMAVDGKNFAALCEPDGGKNEQGDIKDSNELPEVWKTKVEELTTQNKQLVEGTKKTVESLQVSLAQEKLISEEATQVISEMKLKLAEQVEQIEALKLMLADRDARIAAIEVREKEELLLAEGLKEQVILLEEERMLEKKNSVVLLEDFNEWRNNEEEEINELKRELDHRKNTITTLQTELKEVEQEDDGHVKVIAALQKENEILKHVTEPHAVQETQPKRKLKTQTSLKNLLRGIAKPTKDKEGAPPKEKRDKRFSFASSSSSSSSSASSDKRSSVATAPIL